MCNCKYTFYNLEPLKDKLAEVTLQTLQNLLNKIYSTAKIHDLWYLHPRVHKFTEEDVSVLWINGKTEYHISILKNKISYVAYGEYIYGAEYGEIHLKRDLLDFWKRIAR